MILYKCDQCEEIKQGKAAICLEGCNVSEVYGGISLPEGFSKLHFCDGQCFRVWMRITIQKLDEMANEREKVAT